MSTSRARSRDPLLDLVGVQPVEAALEVQQLAAGLPLVQRGLLQRDADVQAHAVGLR